MHGFPARTSIMGIDKELAAASDKEKGLSVFLQQEVLFLYKIIQKVFYISINTRIMGYFV